MCKACQRLFNKMKEQEQKDLLHNAIKTFFPEKEKPKPNFSNLPRSFGKQSHK